MADIRYSDFVESDESVAKLIALLQKLEVVYQKMLNTVRSEAASTKEATLGLSGATEQQQASLRALAVEADKLAKAEVGVKVAKSEVMGQIMRLREEQKKYLAEQKLYIQQTSEQEKAILMLKDAQQLATERAKLSVKASSQNSAEIANLTLAQKRLATEKKLQAQLNSSEVGSYNQLSAQYSINKVKLDNMSLATIHGTEAGKALLAETMQLYTAMDNMQQSTGKFALNVGNYNKRINGMSVATQQIVRELPSLSMGINTFILAISNNIPMLMDQIRLMEKANALAKKNGTATTSVFKTLLGSLFSWQTALIVGITLLATYGKDILEWTKDMFSAGGAASFAAKQLEVYNESLKKSREEQKGQRAELVMLIQATQDNTRSMEDRLSAAYKLKATYKDTLKNYSAEEIAIGKVSGLYKVLITDIENVAKAKAAQAVIEENIAKKLDLEKKLADAKNGVLTFWSEIKLLWKVQAAYDPQNIKNPADAAAYGAKVRADATKEDIATYEEGIRNINIANEKLAKGIPFKDAFGDAGKSDAQARAKAELDAVRDANSARISLITSDSERESAEIRAKYKNQIDDLKLKLKEDENLTKAAKIAIKANIKSIGAQEIRDLEELKAKTAATVLTETRKAEDDELAAMQDSDEKKRKQTELSYSRQIKDIQIRLEDRAKMEPETVAALNRQLVALENEKIKALADLETAANIESLKRQLEANALLLGAAEEGSQSEIDLTVAGIRLQQKIALAENKKLAIEKQQGEVAINAKFDAQVLKATQDMGTKKSMAEFDAEQKSAEAIFALIQRTEEEKTQFKLQQERDRIAQQLALVKAGTMKVSDAEKKAMEDTLTSMDTQLASKKPSKDIYDVFGLKFTEDQKKATNDAFSATMDNLSAYMDAQVESAQIAVDAAQKQVDAVQNRVDAEVEASKNGYANNAAAAQKELELAKKNRDKALKDQEKAQKAQAALETVQQATNLITATAGIWAAFATSPWLAIPMIALMWGSFAAAKIKAAQVTKQKSESYGEGTVELLDGGSHASGHDIDLGVKKDGTRRRAEGGEYLGVVKKRSVAKYGSVIPDVIKALNAGTFEKKYIQSYGGISDTALFNVVSQGTDLGDLNSNVRDIKQQGERRSYSVGGKEIEVYKNIKRIIRA